MFVVVGREHHLIVDVGVKWDAPGNGIVGWISRGFSVGNAAFHSCLFLT